jgi:hypothetical protein
MATNFTTTGVHDGSERLTLAVWCHFSTNAGTIYDDHGVSTLQDNGVGQFIVNFSTNLGLNAYAPVSDTEANSKSAINNYSSALTHILLRGDGGGSYVDANHVQLVCGGGGVA